MAQKCEAILGGNQCGFDADWQIEDLATGNYYFACSKDIGVVMEENEIDHAEIEPNY